MRTSEEINKDYGSAAAELGDLYYKLKFDIPDRIAELEDTIRNLKVEHAKATETK